MLDGEASRKTERPERAHRRDRVWDSIRNRIYHRLEKASKARGSCRAPPEHDEQECAARQRAFIEECTNCWHENRERFERAGRLDDAKLYLMARTVTLICGCCAQRAMTDVAAETARALHSSVDAQRLVRMCRSNRQRGQASVRKGRTRKPRADPAAKQAPTKRAVAAEPDEATSCAAKTRADAHSKSTEGRKEPALQRRPARKRARQKAGKACDAKRVRTAEDWLKGYKRMASALKRQHKRQRRKLASGQQCQRQLTTTVSFTFDVVF